MKCLKDAAAALFGLAIAGLTPAAPAAAFGTIVGLGQNAEHERITRLALACSATIKDACWRGGALDALAGRNGAPGAVGIPDRSALVFSPAAHCDDGDYLESPDYPQTAANARRELVVCRERMQSELDRAVSEAARLVDDGGRISRDEGLDGCFRYVFPRGGARCAVIADLGLLLHAAQDFYAHSNWVDRPDPTRPVSLNNPPGLGQTGPAAFISLRGAGDPPPGLISGCFTAAPAPWICRHRVSHAILNKDEGPIEPSIGVGATPRGRIQDNFARAVRAAIADTKDKWALFQERLVIRYGRVRAERMVCVLTTDQPEAACRRP